METIDLLQESAKTMSNYSKLADAYLAVEFNSSSNDSWAHREREVYSGEVMEKELDELFPIHRLIDCEVNEDAVE